MNNQSIETPQKISDPKNKVDLLMKSYELSLKSFDEHNKLLYGTIPLAGTIIAFGINLLNTNPKLLIIIPLFLFAAFLVLVKLAYELHRISKYLRSLENKINEYFDEPILVWANHHAENFSVFNIKNFVILIVLLAIVFFIAKINFPF